MAVFNKFNSFVEAVCEKVHNLGSDALKVALTNTAPTASVTKLTDLSNPITTGFDNTLSVTSSSQTAGTYKLVLADKVLTATASVGPFRYVVIYNDTAANDELICWYDYGSSVSLGIDDKLTLDFGPELFSLA